MGLPNGHSKAVIPDSTDVPLLPQEEEEVKALAPVLKGMTFAAVLSSPLQRAIRTCALA